ncbi:transcription factor bHLH52-like [Tasmannia lanceolata]|uniref:transcription factor bHLH52-like n=1 Tax=Tasmannia lanceolata TaxID=3420 RepID=UPI00406299E2
MALSCYSNWETFQHLNPEMCTFHQELPELPQELCFYNDFSTQNTLTDPFYEIEDYIYSEENTQLLPHHFPSYPPSLSFSQDFIPLNEFDYYPYPKRARYCDEFYSQDFLFNSFDGSVETSCPVPEFSPEFVFPPAGFHIPTGFSVGDDESSKKNNGVCLSAQSVAARQRRKKISEKTQELGKLIPGGSKMNTAEMFQAAFKYVKYLQAQVGILEFNGPIQESKKGAQLEELHGLLASPRIQEKLYEEEKCLVPKEIVETLAKDQELQSNPSVSKDLRSFLQSMV